MTATGDKQVCVVTGASRGIGMAVARLAASRGYTVCVNFASGEAQARAVVADIERAGGRALAVRADVAREDEVAALFAEVDRKLGPVTALVNNAGIAASRRPVTEIDVADFRRIVDVHLIGTFLCTREAVKRMARSRGGARGSIVNVSSSAVRTGGNGLLPYVAAKAAIEGLTTSLARELAKEGIRVNAVSPGIIATGQQPLGDPVWHASAVARIPLGRLGSPDEVAETILWLLSAEASYVCGANIAVSGGR